MQRTGLENKLLQKTPPAGQASPPLSSEEDATVRGVQKVLPSAVSPAATPVPLAVEDEPLATERSAAFDTSLARSGDTLSATAPVPHLTPTLAACGALTLVSGVIAFGLFYQSHLNKNLALEARSQLHSVARLDETMSSAARLAAETGDKRWVERYTLAQSQMQAVLSSLVKPPHFPASLRESTQELTTSLRPRVTLEKRAVALAATGKLSEARQTIYTTAYEKQRIAFARAQKQTGETVETAINRSHLLEQGGLLTTGVAGLVSCALLTFAGAGARAARRRWGQEMLERQQEVRRTREELARVQYQSDLIARELKRLEEKRDLQNQKLRDTDEINRQKQVLEQAIEAAEDVVMIAEMDNEMPRVVRVNRAFERMTGYHEGELLGRSPKMLQGKDTNPEEVARVGKLLRAGKPVQAELINYRKDGSTFWVQLNIQPVFDEYQRLRYWISIQRDITEQKRVEAAILYQANHDTLTDLPNRNLYQDRLEKAVAQAEQLGHLVGVLFVDLDNFKQVNDSLGHSAGDRLLQMVSERLRGRLRGDEIIARFGGDEFTILLPTITGQAQAASVAQRLLDSLDCTPFMIDDHELTITASVGISIAPTDGRDIDTLLKNADTAMYRAKERRDSFRVYNEAMNARALDRLQIETQLRRALERKEFFLLYQPQVDLKTGEVFGVEALLRWENPVLGRVSPGEFIPIAEEKGWVVEIGAWVLYEACRQASFWHRQGRNIRVSVNLSARQFAQRDLPEQVQDALARFGLPTELLDLELTESLLLGGEAESALHRLKSLGVRLSVDDFGVGYSSFAYLRKLPLDVLKIDKLFVQGLGEDHKSDVMVRVLVEMAHEMPYEVIAEGVETDRQRSILRDMECDGMQGYLYSPPVAVAQIEKLLERKEAETPQLSLVESAPPAGVAPIRLTG